MRKVLTTASTVSCGHGPAKGIVATTGSTRLTVAGQGVLTEAGVQGKSIPETPSPKACALQPSSTTTPCTKVTKVTSGFASKLTVDGKAVLLQEGFDILTDGLPVPPPAAVKAVANQTALTAT